MAERRSSMDLSAYNDTRAAVAADPAVGVASFTTVTTWEEGKRTRTTARSFRRPQRRTDGPRRR